MKSEPARTRMKNSIWVIDESKYLNMAEVRKLRRATAKVRSDGVQNQKYNCIRDWFMVELGLNTGLRVGEMASLKHADLLMDGTRCSIVVIGKGQKKRAIWISAVFKKTCQDFLAAKAKMGFSLDPESHVLNNLSNCEISRRALQKAFKRILAKARLPECYHIHCLRHTYTTFLLKASNHNYRFAQQQLGHASIRTTQVYAGVIESDGRKAVEKLYR